MPDVPSLSSANYEDDEFISYEDEASAAPHDEAGAPVFSSGGTIGGSSGGTAVAGPNESQQLGADIKALEQQHTELTEHYNNEVKNWENQTNAEKANYDKARSEWEKEPRSYKDGEGNIIPLDPGPAPAPPIPIPKPAPPPELNHLQNEIGGLHTILSPPPKPKTPTTARRT